MENNYTNMKNFYLLYSQMETITPQVVEQSSHSQIENSVNNIDNEQESLKGGE